MGPQVIFITRMGTGRRRKKRSAAYKEAKREIRENKRCCADLRDKARVLALKDQGFTFDQIRGKCKSLRTAQRNEFVRARRYAFVKQWFYAPITTDARAARLQGPKKTGRKGYPKAYRHKHCRAFIKANNNQDKRVSLLDYCRKHSTEENPICPSTLRLWLHAEEYEAFEFRRVPRELTKDIETCRMEYAEAANHFNWRFFSFSDEAWCDLNETTKLLKGKAFYWCKPIDADDIPSVLATKWSSKCKVGFFILLDPHENYKDIKTFENTDYVPPEDINQGIGPDGEPEVCIYIYSLIHTYTRVVIILINTHIG